MYTKDTFSRWAELLAAGVIVLLLVGCNFPLKAGGKPGATVDGALGMEGYPLVTREQIGRIPAGTHVKVSGILANGGKRLYRIIARDEVSAEAREDQLMVAPGVVLMPTPTMAFIDALGWGGYPLVTLEQVGGIPTGTRVMTGSAWFDGINTVYQITDQDGSTAEAREDQLALAPGVTLGPTPTAVFDPLWNVAGFPLITLEQVGAIPAKTPVRISSTWFDGLHRFYQVTDGNRVSAEAREDQLAIAPGYTPAPVPTAVLDGSYPLITLEQVGSIQPNTLVRSGGSWYNGSEIMYQITAQDGSTAEAREYQLAYAPGVTPGPTPTAVFEHLWNVAGFPLITLEQIGNIPARTPVRGWRIRFDGLHGFYQVTDRNGVSAEAREDQLAAAPGYTPAPEPTAAFEGGFPLITLEQVGNIPANTIVRYGGSTYNGSEIIYQIFADNGTTAEAREYQLAYAPGVTPGPTPTAVFEHLWNVAGFPLITLEQVGAIPAQTPVRISSTWFDGLHRFYQVIDGNGVSADAREDQLAVAPGIVPGPTPSAQFGAYLGMGFLLMTTEQVGNIPAGVRVRISHASYDGAGWIYFIVAQDEVTTAEARENQLALAPYASPGPSPTFVPTPPPTSKP